MIHTSLKKGDKFNHWTLIHYSPECKPDIRWLCRCDCGFEKIQKISVLRNGRSKCCKSCASRQYFKKTPGLFEDLTNRKIGKWTVLYRVNNRYGYRSYWLCRCECGTVKELCSQRLKQKKAKQCSKCYIRLGNRTHGSCIGGKIPEYHIWRSMKERCMNKNNKNYKNYGERGIKVCDRWINSFKCFIEDVGRKPFKNASLDRINNDGNYEQNNVRWTTRVIQARNTRKQKYGICITHWSKENNLDRHLVGQYLNEGLTLEEVKNKVHLPYKQYPKQTSTEKSHLQIDVEQLSH